MCNNAQSYINAGYENCTKGIHKNVFPMHTQWRKAERVISNKCNHLVFASILSLDSNDKTAVT
jgi:hypothetical protein